MKQQRRHYSAEEKAKISLEALRAASYFGKAKCA
jgi:hypothetical protein